MSLKSRLFPALLAFGMVFTTGCQPKPQAPTQTITLEFWTLQLDSFKSTLEPMFLAYEHAHPGVKIHWVDIPFSEGPKRTLTALMGGRAPDVVNLNPDFSAILASRNALVDMNQALPAETRASYLPVAWQAATLQKSTKQLPNKAPLAFGVPWYVTSSITIYNQALLKRAGVAQPPDSYEALIPYLQQVKTKTGAYGYMPVITESGNFLKELQKIGVTLYNSHGKAVFATGQAIAHLESYVDAYRQGLFPAETISESHQASVGRFQAGSLAMLSIGPNFLKIVKENAPDIYRSTAVAPQLPASAPVKDFALMVLVVPIKSPHPKEAADFAAFMTNGPNQLALSQAAPVLPSITSALQEVAKAPALPDSSSDKIAPSDALMQRGRAMSAQQLLAAKAAYRIQPNQNAINDLINYYVQMALLGKMTPEAALKRAETEINATLETGPQE